MFRFAALACLLVSAPMACKRGGQEAEPPHKPDATPTAKEPAQDPDVVPEVLKGAVNLPAPPLAVTFTLPPGIEAAIDPDSGQAIMWSFIKPDVGGVAVTWTALSPGDVEFMNGDPMEFFGSRAAGGEGSERIDASTLTLNHDAEGRVWRNKLGDAEQTAVVIYLKTEPQDGGGPAPIVGFVVGIVMMGSPNSGWTFTGEHTEAVMDSLDVVVRK